MNLRSSSSVNGAGLFAPTDDVWKPVDLQRAPDAPWPVHHNAAAMDDDVLPLWLLHMVDSLPDNDLPIGSEDDLDPDVPIENLLPPPVPLCAPSSFSAEAAACVSRTAAPLPGDPMRLAPGARIHHLAWQAPAASTVSVDVHALLRLHVAGLATHNPEQERMVHSQRPLSVEQRAHGHPSTFFPAPFQAPSTEIVFPASGPLDASCAFVCMHTQAGRDRALIEMPHSLPVPRDQSATPLRPSLHPAKSLPAAPAKVAPRSRHAPRRTLVSRHRENDVRESVPRPFSFYNEVGRPVNQCCGRPDCKFHLHTRITVTELHFLEEGKARGKASAHPGLVSTLISAHRASAFDPKNTTVFIGSLLSLTTDTVLESVFPLLGKVLSVNIPRGQDCGFVQYERKCDAAHAVVYLHKYITPMHSLRMSWGRLVVEKVAARAAVRAGLKWVEGRQVA